jgi:CP family cyanate transporter-like MFS transporter
VKNTAPSTDEQITNTWSTVIVYALITLLGFNLRSVILAVPPVLPLIQHDLGLSYTAAGLLTALPILMLGGGAWSVGLLVRRIGGRASVTIGLALLGAGALLRAFIPNVFLLYLFTVLLSLGIAVAQTAVPVLARFWYPRHIGLVTALFTDGLIIGEATGAGVTVPLMVHLLGADAWIGTFVFWGVPVVAMLALWLWLAPRSSTRTPATPPATSRRGQIDRAPQRSLRSAFQFFRAPHAKARVSALHLGIMLGAGSLVYFGMNGWIASYNHAIRHEDLTPLALVILNAAQLPASLGVTFFSQQIAGRRWPFIIAGIICTIAIIGWVFAPAVLEPLWAALLGGSSALVFTLGIALPPLLAGPEEVARLTGITFSLSYCVAFVGPFVGGGLWDIFYLPAMAFLPVAVAGITLVILGALLPPRASFGFAVEGVSVSESDASVPTS